MPHVVTTATATREARGAKASRSPRAAALPAECAFLSPVVITGWLQACIALVSVNLWGGPSTGLVVEQITGKLAVAEEVRQERGTILQPSDCRSNALIVGIEALSEFVRLLASGELSILFNKLGVRLPAALPVGSTSPCTKWSCRTETVPKQDHIYSTCSHSC